MERMQSLKKKIRNKIKELGVLRFHMRTLVLLPEEFVLKLYQAAREAGFKYIVGIEQIGISRATHSQYIFTNDCRLSVPFRNGMYIHNYPGLLSQENYSPQQAELIKTGHVHPDLRVLNMVGSRKEI